MSSAWPTLQAGELTNQINILQQVIGSGPAGEAATMEPFLSNIWCKIEDVRGIDVIKSGLVTTQLFLVITMWWQAGILPNMQVQAPNGLYVIQSVENPLEKSFILKLNCLALGLNDQ